ncbi:hypothetical protein DFH28DRAFT_921805 [Melampsora americana]|nr:hypothetical protein DFH28DRAFT_921805 [Melampsora americana]
MEGMKYSLIGYRFQEAKEVVPKTYHQAFPCRYFSSLQNISVKYTTQLSSHSHFTLQSQNPSPHPPILGVPLKELSKILSHATQLSITLPMLNSFTFNSRNYAEIRLRGIQITIAVKVPYNLSLSRGRRETLDHLITWTWFAIHTIIICNLVLAISQ